MSTFTSAQIASIDAKRSSGDFPGAYLEAASIASNWLFFDRSVVLWLRGAAQINTGSGPFSDFVRSYTEAQYFARYGTSLSPSAIQSVSDQIAGLVLDYIVTHGTLPSISQIALHDAGPAAADLFEGDPGGWAGNPMFVALGHYSAFANNIVETDGDTYDALAMIKFAAGNNPVALALSGLIEFIENDPDGILEAGALSAAAVAHTLAFLVLSYGEAITEGVGDHIYLGRVNGHDSIGGSNGDDIVNAGGGDDTLYLTGGDDLLDGGAGDDTASYSAAESINVEISEWPGGVETLARFVGQVIAGGNTDKLFNIEKIVGSGGDDTFTIKSFPAGAPIELDADEGEDTLDLSEMNRGVMVNAVTGEISADGGAATIAGFEKFIGGDGADTFVLTGTETRVEGGEGYDFADFSMAEQAISGPIVLTGIELVHGSEFADALQADGQGMHLRGGAGQDQLAGGGGSDILEGSDDDEADTLTGGGDTDLFLAGDGDIITDATAEDRLSTSPGNRVSGEATREEGSSGPYTNAEGHTFTKQGDDLVIEANGVTITVQDFEDGDLGITLSEDDDEDPPGDGPGRGSGGSPFPSGPFYNPPASPLVLDLDGDGLEITALAGTTVHFDLDASGSREATGWLGSDDGFLVFDANSDGSIENGHELFGNTQTNGFDVLAYYDGRTGGDYYTDYEGGSVNLALQDGVIDADDPIYSQLQIWRDLDQDGRSDAGELFSLSSLGIQSIDLGYASTNIPVHEHSIRQVSSAQTSGGQVEISDVWFKTDRTNTEFDYDPDTVGFASWPDLHAIGTLPSLRLAMHQDPDLAQAVSDFLADAETLSIEGLQSRFFEILLIWAGVEDHPVDGRGNYFPDARILEFLEAAHDQAYLQLEGFNAGTANPGPNASAAIMEAFGAARDTLMLQFLSQVPDYYMDEAATGNTAYVVSRFHALSPAFEYDLATGTHRFNAALLAHSLPEFDPTDLESMANVTALLDFLPLISRSLSGQPQDLFVGLGEAFLEAGRPDLTVFVDWYFTTSDPTSPVHGHPRGAVRVLAEDAEVAASHTSDLLVVSPDLGLVRVQQDLMADRILLTEAFDGASFTCTQDPSTGDVTVVFTDLGVTLLLEGYFAPDPYLVTNLGAVIYFAGGATLRPEDLRAAVVGAGTTGDDDLVGTTFDETFAGLDGDDSIYGGGGNDILDGGAGNDVLVGGLNADVITGGAGDDVLGSLVAQDNWGADTFVFAAGHGHDTVQETAGIGANTVWLQDADEGDVVLTWVGDDLVISVAGRPNDSICIAGFRSSEVVSVLRFADGSEWRYGDIVNEALLQQAGPGDDVLIGTSGRDVLAGGLGNDTLKGATSSFTDGDLFLYKQGDGNDVIYASYSYTDDELVLRGIQPSQVSVTRNGNDAVLTFAAGGSVTLHDQFDELGWNVLERITFDNGVVWSERDLAYAVQGSLSAPTITGTAASETLTGTSGRDGLEGAGGDDRLEGGQGADTYFFGPGGGHDVIRDNGGDDAVEADSIVLAAAPEDVVIERNGVDVVLTLPGGETLTIENFFSANSSRLDPASAIERLIFSDGTEWDASAIAKAAWIRGTSGADTLAGTAGADTLSGGAGDDLMNGGSGSDLYVVRSGDGDDTIAEPTDTGADVVWFQDALQEDVRVLWGIGDDEGKLIVERLDGTGSVRLDYDGRVETVRFSDGSTMDLEDLAAVAILEGTEASEELSGHHLGGVIEGREGADDILGGNGFDIYNWSRGDGDDVIRDYGSQLGALHLRGTDPGLITLSRAPTLFEWDDNLYDLVVTIHPLLQTDVTETIRIAGFFREDGEQFNGITSIVFDNGAVWSVGELIARSTLSGTTSDDSLSGTTFADRIEGGEGDDVLSGRVGSDTYVWSTGDGNDTLSEQGEAWETDTLHLTDVRLEDVELSRDGYDLLVRVLATDEVITIEWHFWDNDPEVEGPPGSWGLERIVFADAFELDRAAILALVPPDEPSGEYDGTPDDDYISGDGDDNVLRGFAGYDVLEGNGGDDRLEGGEDNDELYGGDGADTYAYRDGDGDDVIYEEGEGSDVDTLVFEDLDRAEVSVVFDQYGLTFQTATGSVELADQFTYELGYSTWELPGGGVELVSFADQADIAISDLLTEALSAGGTTVTYGTNGDDPLTGSSGADALVGMGGDDTLVGAAGDDRLFGGAGADVLNGGLGSDELVGGTGDDLYLYALGDGDDVLVDADENDQNDTLQLGAGISQGDVVVTRVDGDAVLTFSGGGSITLRDQFYGSGIDVIDFASGSDWTMADLHERYLETAGTSGSDIIYGSGGDDVLIGGGGDDDLMGDAGADTYLISAGDGQDYASDSDDSDVDVDRVIFTDLASTSVTVLRAEGNPKDVILAFAGGQQVWLTNTMVGDPLAPVGMGIDEIVFSDSITWDRQDIADAYFAAAVTSGDDRIEGFGWGDQLTGGAGADTFVFSYEFGHDRIEDFSLVEDVVEVWGAADFEQLMTGAVQIGNDVTIDLAWDGSITLANIDIEDLTAAHFAFGQPQMFSARGNGQEVGDDGLMDMMIGEAAVVPEIDDLLGWSGGGGWERDVGLATNSSARLEIGSLMDELRDRSFSVPHQQDYCFA